jgi:hypothetical protein
LYFFGIKPPRGSVGLARVQSTFAKITDPAAYQYWDGTTWVPGDAAAAEPVIPETADLSPRSELSVAFNAAAHMWTMMLLNEGPNPGQIELWQAPAVTGPWRKVDADEQLPNGQEILHYGPMMTEHLMRDGGLQVPFLLTQTLPIYNVHLWSYSVNLAPESCPR